MCMLGSSSWKAAAKLSSDVRCRTSNVIVKRSAALWLSNYNIFETHHTLYFHHCVVSILICNVVSAAKNWEISYPAWIAIQIFIYSSDINVRSSSPVVVAAWLARHCCPAGLWPWLLHSVLLLLLQCPGNH